jgi:hypothetical protein
LVCALTKRSLTVLDGFDSDTTAVAGVTGVAGVMIEFKSLIKLEKSDMEWF